MSVVSDEIVDAFIANQLGLELNQVKFIRLIKRDGVQVHMTEEAKKSPKFQELVAELSKLHQAGVITSFEVVDA